MTYSVSNIFRKGFFRGAKGSTFLMKIAGDVKSWPLKNLRALQFREIAAEYQIRA